MEYDLDQVVRDVADRLRRLLRESKRLRAENEQLLRENKELREEVTLERLYIQLEGDLPDRPAHAGSPEAVLPREALEFYRDLPDKINFSDFFRIAEDRNLSGERAREFMLLCFRGGLLQQRGRLLLKKPSIGPARWRDIEGCLAGSKGI